MVLGILSAKEGLTVQLVPTDYYDATVLGEVNLTLPKTTLNLVFPEGRLVGFLYTEYGNDNTYQSGVDQLLGTPVSGLTLFNGTTGARLAIGPSTWSLSLFDITLRPEPKQGQLVSFGDSSDLASKKFYTVKYNRSDWATKHAKDAGWSVTKAYVPYTRVIPTRTPTTRSLTTTTSITRTNSKTSSTATRTPTTTSSASRTSSSLSKTLTPTTSSLTHTRTSFTLSQTTTIPPQQIRGVVFRDDNNDGNFSSQSDTVWPQFSFFIVDPFTRIIFGQATTGSDGFFAVTTAPEAEEGQQLVMTIDELDLSGFFSFTFDSSVDAVVYVNLQGLPTSNHVGGGQGGFGRR